MTLPPGPQRPAIVQVAQWSMRPLPLLDECARRFGDVFTLRLPGLGAFVLVSTPELNKQVFTADPEVLLAGKANEILRILVGSSSILLLDGAEHLRQRRLLMPSFHGERMHAYGEQMRDITEAELDRLPLGETFSLHPPMQSITLDVILRAVFGLDEGSQMQQFSAVLVELFRPVPAFMIFMPPEKLDFPLSPYRTFVKRREIVDQELYKLISARRQAKDLSARTDILSLMLLARDEQGQPMTDVELRDELITMIAAGHETSATSLTWIFERILFEPRVAEKVYAEISEVVGDGPVDPAALPRLEYLDAVIKETLRLRPIVPLVVRRVETPYSIGGYELPVGSHVAPCIYLTHRHPDIYPDPERFLPERFLGAKIDPYAWMPFGGGTRRCIGMAFALYEMKIILATVLSRARMHLASADPIAVVRRGLILAPSNGTRVVLTHRAPRGRMRAKAAA